MGDILSMALRYPYPLPLDVSNGVVRLQNWDLSAIRRRVRRRMDWSENFVGKLEREYRRFVSLAIFVPSEVMGMAGHVDEFWHEHLDTED